MGMTGSLIVLATLVTAIISGIFGMAGGMILMGVLTFLLPVSTAMIMHGAIQTVSNGWRAFLLRDQISWSVIGRYLIGGVPGIGLLVFLAWRPDKTWVFLLLGLIAFVPWIPRRWFHLDVLKPFQAEALGFIAQSLNTIAGVVGPILDIFFVETNLTRQQIVATKAATQVLAHMTKIVFWSLPLIGGMEEDAFPPAIWIIAAIPVSMLGTWIGGRILALMTDASFRDWTKWILTLIGSVYLWRAITG